MNRNGFLFAVLQYFTVDEKPRLYPKNSWFEDHQISEKHAEYFYIIATAILFISVVLMMVVVL